jgi:hypothetical protein
MQKPSLARRANEDLPASLAGKVVDCAAPVDWHACVGSSSSLACPDDATEESTLAGIAVLSFPERIMRSGCVSTGSVLCLATVVLAGCQTPGNRAYDKDPLVLSKKPIEATIAGAAPVQVASAELTPPPVPETAIALKKREVTATPVATVKKPLVAIPAVRRRNNRTDEVSAPVASCGHAPDYSWLQGVLARDAQGLWELRYGDPAVADDNDGVVSLEGDPRLGPFREGDLIRVEGEVLPDEEAESGGMGKWPPGYRIRVVCPAR